MIDGDGALAGGTNCEIGDVTIERMKDVEAGDVVDEGADVVARGELVGAGTAELDHGPRGRIDAEERGPASGGVVVVVGEGDDVGRCGDIRVGGGVSERGVDLDAANEG